MPRVSLWKPVVVGRRKPFVNASKHDRHVGFRFCFATILSNHLPKKLLPLRIATKQHERKYDRTVVRIFKGLTSIQMVSRIPTEKATCGRHSASVRPTAFRAAFSVCWSHQQYCKSWNSSLTLFPVQRIRTFARPRKPIADE